MARLHLAYREDAYNGRLLELTRRLIASKPWGMHKRRKFETWLHGANLVFGLPEVTLARVPLKSPASAVGEYDPTTRTIRLARWSLVSLFHQYRHHQSACLAQQQGRVWSHNDDGQDAQEWACSLLYLVAPKTFRRAVRNGRVAGVHAPDLMRGKRSQPSGPPRHR